MAVRLRDNNFDALRLAFALAVFLWHVHALAQVPALAPLAGAISLAADWGVKGFFVISGYLVMQSYENSPTVLEYAAKRVRRIYPAYCAVVLASVLMGAVLTTLPLGDYLSGGLVRFIAANLAFLNFLSPELPGVFQGQRFPEVNGALWTLKIEVMFYVFLPVLAWMLARIGRWPVVVSLYALSVAYGVILGTLHERTGDGLWLQLQRQLPGQLSYFLVGVALYDRRDMAAGGQRIAVAAAAAALIAIRLLGHSALTAALEPVALGVLVVFAATGIRHLGNAARFGDLSYGVYIIHFPVLQSLVLLGTFRDAPWVGFGASVALVLLLAAASWHIVERPFLKRDSHYRLAGRRKT
ncbi:MAG: hypothetical protein A3G83_13395 [Betaproteobacteria bacterium RIFCSPLOWO2_12_FULL_68_20]|nr:MAG: hypothetical protein A3G83_13395 [Betaproteobacteria bacterium RIFCSPLOWO2_12_FULL_68_20]